MVFPTALRNLAAFRFSLSHLACAAALCCAWPAAQAQSLVELTERAQTYDAAWQSARAQYEATLSQSAQAKAGLLPQIGIQADSQYSETRVRGDFPSRQLDARQDSASLQATQPLYNPANFATYKQGQFQAELAQIQLDAASQDLLVRTAQAYFQVLTTQETLKLVRAQQRSVAEQYEFAKRRFEIGDATITDAREAQSRLDLIRAQEIAAANDVRVAQAALDQLLGTSNASPWPLAQPERLPELTPGDLQAWLDQAENHSPQIRQTRIAQDIARLETDKAYAGHKPTVDLQASYGTQRNPDGSLTQGLPGRVNSTVGSVGVVMNIPLFAGFAVQNRVKETLSLEEKARADLEGVRINLDVLNAQSQLFQSQKDLAHARYQLLLGLLQLRQAAGNLRMQDVHTINAVLSPAAQNPAQPAS